MHNITLETSSLGSPENFEDVRFHTINYILDNGKLVMGSSIGEDRFRPDWREGEYGVVMGSNIDNLIYAFRVDPLVRDKDRGLKIVVMGSDPEALEREVEKIRKNTGLRVVD